MSGYQYLTSTQAVSMLARRLQDPGNVYWTAAELQSALAESLRVLNAATGTFRQKIQFSTTPDLAYYDLSSPAVAGTQLGYTVTDTALIQEVLSALLEGPPLFQLWSDAGPSWSGSGQFTAQQVMDAIQSRLNRFLGDSGIVTTPLRVRWTSPPDALLVLPDGVLDVRRVGWTPLQVPPAQPSAVGTYPLARTDDFGVQTYLPKAPTDDLSYPQGWSVYGYAPLQLRLAPPPAVDGSLDLLVVNSGPQLNFDPANPVLLGIPDDFAWVVRWGALADLLSSDGPCRDGARAEYCEMRYREGVELASDPKSMLTAEIGKAGVGVGSVYDLDTYMPQWQINRGTPSFIGMCGRNLACLGVTPDSNGGQGGYGVTAWCIANMPVTNFLQISRDCIDPVLDFAQHVASFKMGGTEWAATVRLEKSLATAAAGLNGRLRATSFYRHAMDRVAGSGELQVPRIDRMEVTA